jgi:hypothetical protein
MNYSYPQAAEMSPFKLWGSAAVIALFAFCISFAVLRERPVRRNMESRIALSARNAVASEDANPSPKSSPPTIGRRDKRKPAVTAEPIASPSDTQAVPEPMPVNLAVVQNSRRKRIEAFISNLSNNSISIEVGITASSTGKTSTFTLDLVPQGTATFGSDEDMVMTEGDLITLKSGEYPPLSHQVP